MIAKKISTLKIKQDHKPHECEAAALFGASIFLILILSLVGACVYSGPMILGTEMNANGTVEYLCLGNGCEDFTTME